MQTRNIAAQIIKPVAAGLSGGVQINAVETFHNIDVIRDFVLRHNRLAETLDFDIFAVVLAYGHGVGDDIRNDQHPLAKFCGEGFLLFFQIL